MKSHDCAREEKRFTYEYTKYRNPVPISGLVDNLTSVAFCLIVGKRMKILARSNQTFVIMSLHSAVIFRSCDVKSFRRRYIDTI